jgi:hypothetical protein
MDDPSYRVVQRSDSTYAVEIRYAGGALEGASGFRTEAEAQAWIAEKKRRSGLNKATSDDKASAGDA